ncbi:glycine--tRNA ligase subunit beta [Ampullimonas aquatilis]|uniref:glycine--tRNA ligase subunit beta n=1 Tax=Ampullimonas aquatilis TaxID=1341549 RepID=UPI003C7867CD
MSKNNLLVELFVEELPPKALNKLGESFAQSIFAGLAKLQLVDATEQANIKAFASPRRLAVWIPNVQEKAADRPDKQKLMPVSVGLDANGQATPALLKKLAALGADAAAVSQLKRESDGKAEALFYESLQAGATLQSGLQDALTDALGKLPIPKVMTYQLADGWETVNFVRPAHGLVALHGEAIVPISILGLQSGRTTQGHRFEASVSPISLTHADHYAEQMANQGAVLAAFSERRAEIVRQLNAAAAKVGGGVKPIQDAALLDEVTALVERPNVLIGQFEASFLTVPQECLILTMKANQKYFPLLDTDGKLTNQFLLVSNISPADPTAVIGGNERVVRPRLADAKFFFEQDQKKKLEDRVPLLGNVVYHNKLGNQLQRCERVRAIARVIGKQLSGNDLANQADLAAKLAKADLLTDMVGEFPELQGIMGGYYARHENLGDDIAEAIEDHYKPRFAGDALPRNQVGVVVALADKLETLVGLFGIGQLPTGDKDPFALRRHALGVVRILIEQQLPLSVQWLIDNAQAQFGTLLNNEQLQDTLSVFIYERLGNSLREQGFSAHEVEAVLALRAEALPLNDLRQRLDAVHAFAALPEAESLAAANKRISNILKKADEDATLTQTCVHNGLLKEAAEEALCSAVTMLTPQAEKLFVAHDYSGYLKLLASLRNNVDGFFKTVMVMDEDMKVRANRIALLRKLHGLMNRVADLAKLAS